MAPNPTCPLGDGLGLTPATDRTSLEKQLQAVRGCGRILLVNELRLSGTDHAVPRKRAGDRARTVCELRDLRAAAEGLEVGIAEPLELGAARREVELPRDRSEDDRQGVELLV